MTTETTPTRPTAVAVTGLGFRLPGVLTPEQLRGLPGGPTPRRFRRRAPEAAHALDAAADALTGAVPWAGGRTGTVWATSTAGLAEYGQTCADIPVAGPARVSPRRTARSAFTAPVTAVSVHFGLSGPYLNLTGDRDAGANAVVEAVRMLQQHQCGRVVAGGSAGASTWRPGPAGILAEGALCAVLQRDPGPRPQAAADGLGTTVRPLGRLRVPTGGPEPVVRDYLSRMARPPDHVVLSAPVPGTATARALTRLCAAPCTRVEERIGDLGAAGGIAALVMAVVLAAAPGRPERPGARVLALTAGIGHAVAIEVTSRRRSPQ